MSDPAKPAGPLAESHAQRSRFQGIAYNAALSVIICAAVMVLIGIALPPPALDTKAGDWGLAIVQKSVAAVPVFLALLGTLGAWLGLTLARGAHDARLGDGDRHDG
jgi:fumarate reductase subunit D